MTSPNVSQIADYYREHALGVGKRITNAHNSGAFFVNIHEGDNTDFLEQLGREKGDPNRILVGIAGETNLNILALSGMQGALLLAPDRDQRLMWEAALDLLKKCPTADAFRSFWEDVVDGNNGFRFFKPENERVFFTRDADDPNASWLMPEHYDQLRMLAQQGQIAIVDTDLLNTQQCKILGEAIGKGGGKVGMTYASNILGYYISLGKLGQGYLGDPAPKTAEAMQVLAENIAAIAGVNTPVVDGSFKTRRSFETADDYSVFIKDAFENPQKYVLTQHADTVSKNRSWLGGWFGR